MGRKIRHERLQNFKREIPPVGEIIQNKTILVEKWFTHYLKLINFGTREFKEIIKVNNKIKLVYTCYANSQKKKYVKYIPATITLDDDFQYFFGLWCGDRLGKGRIGIANKNKGILDYAEKYLIKLYQTPEKVLQYHFSMERPSLTIEVDRTQIIKSDSMKGKKGYVIMVGNINGILSSFFHYLDKNIDEVLGLLPNKYAFFSGLFDAEGNVSLEDKCVRWSCLNMEKVHIYQKYLKNLDLFDRYDGCSLVSYNLKVFQAKILSFLKNKDKTNRINLLSHNEGTLEKRFLVILEKINELPYATNNNLAKALKRAKRYAQLKFLEDAGYILRAGYPKKAYLTEKGLEQIKRGNKK